MTKSSTRGTHELETEAAEEAAEVAEEVEEAATAVEWVEAVEAVEMEDEATDAADDAEDAATLALETEAELELVKLQRNIRTRNKKRGGPGERTKWSKSRLGR